MGTIKLNIHSIIDVITNSSTEIYTYASSDAVDKVYELLNEVLKIAGSDKKAEDLFSVYVEPQDWDVVWEQVVEDLKELPKGFDKKTVCKFIDDMDVIDNYSDRRQYMTESVVPYLREDNRWKYVDCEDSWDDRDANETSIVIKSIDDSVSDKDIYKMFWGLFYQHAMYDG